MSARAAASRTGPSRHGPIAARLLNGPRGRGPRSLRIGDWGLGIGDWGLRALNRRDRAGNAVGEGRDAVTELAHGLGAVERPIMAENLDRTACDERRAPEHARA